MLMQLEIHVFLTSFNTFHFVCLCVFFPLLRFANRRIFEELIRARKKVHQKIQFMHTLSCCGELTPFCRLPKYSRLTSCLCRNQYVHTLYCLWRRQSNTSANIPGHLTLHFIRMKNPDHFESFFFFILPFSQMPKR